MRRRVNRVTRRVAVGTGAVPLALTILQERTGIDNVNGALMDYAGAIIACTVAPAATQSRSRNVIADQRFVVTTEAGSGLLPLFLLADWSEPTFHGTGRNALSYFRTGKKRVAGDENAGSHCILSSMRTSKTSHHLTRTSSCAGNPAVGSGYEALAPVTSSMS